MNKVPHMVSMEIDQKEEKEEAEVCGAPEVNKGPRYPYGLAICLTQYELDKMDVDYEDWSVGDTFHLHAFAKITSISEQETNQGNKCRIELQIVALSGEDEEEEDEEEEQQEDKGFRPLAY